MLPDISNSTIRQRAWELCRKNYMKILSITLTVSLISWIASLLGAFISFNATMAFVVSLLIAVVDSVMQFGMNLFALHLWRGEPAGTNDLWEMVSQAPRVVGIVLLTALCTVVPSLATGLFASLFTGSLLLYFAILTPTMLLVIWVTLRISYAPLAFIFDTDRTAKDCIRASWEATRGHAWRIFCNTLVLSLPLMIALALMSVLFTDGSLIYGIITLLFQTLFNGYIALGETGLGELLLTGRSMCAPYSVDSQQPGQPEEAFRLESGDDDADN